MIGRQKEERNRRIESRRQDNAKYERFGVQGMTDKEIGRLIYWSLYH